MKLHEKLIEIQLKLKAKKGQFNKFGNYYYRSCEDILEAVKPLLKDCSLTLSDSIELIGDRYYVKAEAKVIDETGFLNVFAYAREPLTQKGMADPQITGSASSYARKYALSGLFCIDDTKDSDAQEPQKDVIKEAFEKLKEVKSFDDLLSVANQYKNQLTKDAKLMAEYAKLKKQFPKP